ncbi:yojK [Symbiodinium pilosum]|uniref:YojK protein n=1 Tax=Symbiodinium pilosum TaxID=2952 RepID=A0A812MLC2_SYMPI|nr:yojK [Symbiodinium pilosum]
MHSSKANLTKEEGLYADLQKRVQKEIARLTDQQLAADKRLRELQAAKDKKQEQVDKLREDAVERGSIARNASEEADVVQANLAEAEGLVNKHRRLAEASEKAFLQAKMDVDHAERQCLDSEHEVAEKNELKLRVLAARNALQNFYDSMDNLSRSLEPKIVDPEVKAYELLRKDPLAVGAMQSYNDVTSSFRRLFVKSKETYSIVVGSIPEIQSNAEAALRLLCDPFELLEEEARRTGNFNLFDEKCGTGLWVDLKMERSSFPNLEDADAEPEREESIEAMHEEDDEGSERPGEEPAMPSAGLPPPPLNRMPSKTTPAPGDEHALSH